MSPEKKSSLGLCKEKLIFLTWTPLGGALEEGLFQGRTKKARFPRQSLEALLLAYVLEVGGWRVSLSPFWSEWRAVRHSSTISFFQGLYNTIDYITP